jgi:GNAT superfamily N-acetyltransferase
MISILIRPYEPRDIGPVTSLVRSLRAAAELGADFGGLGVDVRGTGRGAHAREADGPPSETFVAEDDGLVVGVAAAVGVDRAVCALRRLYVAPGQQGRGGGGELLAAVRGWAAAQGYRRITAEVPGAFAPAREFLARRGFVGVGGSVWVLQLPT